MLKAPCILQVDHEYRFFLVLLHKLPATDRENRCAIDRLAVRCRSVYRPGGQCCHLPVKEADKASGAIKLNYGHMPMQGNARPTEVRFPKLFSMTSQALRGVLKQPCSEPYLLPACVYRLTNRSDVQQSTLVQLSFLCVCLSRQLFDVWLVRTAVECH